MVLIKGMCAGRLLSCFPHIFEHETQVNAWRRRIWRYGHGHIMQVSRHSFERSSRSEWWSERRLPLIMNAPQAVGLVIFNLRPSTPLLSPSGLGKTGKLQTHICALESGRAM